jgi:hypothetical protein
MTTEKTLKTNPSIASKIRRALREMQAGQDAIFNHKTDFRA